MDISQMERDELLQQAEALRVMYFDWAGRDDRHPLALEVDGAPLKGLVVAARGALAVALESKDSAEAVWDLCIQNGENITWNVDAVRSYDAWVAEQNSQCGAPLTIGPAHDPYGTNCDLSVDHAGDQRAAGEQVVHAGPHPMGDGRIRWTGGGSLVGDPLPFHIIEETHS